METKKKDATPDEMLLNKLIDEHMDAMEFEKYLILPAIVIYPIGGLMFIFGTGMIEAMGLALVGASLIAWGAHLFYASPREKKKRDAVVVVINRINRKAVLPFYQELQEKFADEPGVHLHLNDSGTITVTRKKRKEK